MRRALTLAVALTMAGASVAWAATIANDSATTPAGVAVTINVLANDSTAADCTAANLRVSASTAKDVTTASTTGAAWAVNGDKTITATPKSGFTGSDSLTYSVWCSNSGTETLLGSATISLTVTAPLRSITVSASANPLAFDKCWASYTAWAGASYGSAAPLPQLTPANPNGFCMSGMAQNSVTITNAGSPGHINVGGSDATGPSGASWTLVTTTGGTNQFALANYAKTATGSTNGSSVAGHQIHPQASADCDTVFDQGSCAAASGQVGHEDVGLGGPASSTVNGSYAFTVTWTAVS